MSRRGAILEASSAVSRRRKLEKACTRPGRPGRGPRQRMGVPGPLGAPRDGPRQPRNGTRGPQEASEGSTRAQSLRIVIPRRRRWPHDGSRKPPRRPKSPPRGPREAKIAIFFRKTYILSIFASWAFTASKSAQETPKTAQEAPKRAPRRPKRGPRRPRRPPRRPERASGRAQ